MKPIEIDLDNFTISIILSPISSNRDNLSTDYSISIKSKKPVCQNEMNQIIQKFLLFISVILGRNILTETYATKIASGGDGEENIFLRLSYGDRISKENQSRNDFPNHLIRKGAEDIFSYFNKWESSFDNIENLAKHYIRALDNEGDEILFLLFVYIHHYSKSVLGCEYKNLESCIRHVIKDNIDHFKNSKKHSDCFNYQNLNDLSNELANYRNDYVHKNRDGKSTLSYRYAFSYMITLTRFILLKNMGYNVDNNEDESAIQGWWNWWILDETNNKAKH